MYKSIFEVSKEGGRPMNREIGRISQCDTGGSGVKLAGGRWSLSGDTPG